MPVCKFQFLYQNWLVGELQKFKNPLLPSSFLRKNEDGDKGGGKTNNSGIVTDTSSDSVQSEKM